MPINVHLAFSDTLGTRQTLPVSYQDNGIVGGITRISEFELNLFGLLYWEPLGVRKSMMVWEVIRCFFNYFPLPRSLFKILHHG